MEKHQEIHRSENCSKNEDINDEDVRNTKVDQIDCEFSVEMHLEIGETSDSTELTCPATEDEIPAWHQEFLEIYKDLNKSIMTDEEKERIDKLIIRCPVKKKKKRKSNRMNTYRGGRRRKTTPLRIKRERVARLKENSVVSELTPIAAILGATRKDTPCCSKILPKETSYSQPKTLKPKKRPVNKRKKKRPAPKKEKPTIWYEDIQPDVSVIGPNQLLIDGVSISVDKTNYIKDSEVYFGYDVDDSAQLPLPGFLQLCGNDFCRLGCICESIGEKEIERSKCSNEMCIFGCICKCKTSKSKGDDARNILSRLRPRSRLLHSKHLGGKEKVALVNYRELGNGGAYYLRKRRAVNLENRGED